MNIFLYEFTKQFKTLWVWSVQAIALLYIFMPFYQVLAADARTLDLFMQYYPEELLQAFGMGGELSLATIVGYFAFAFTFVHLLLAVQGAFYGFQFLSVEERELTADFLYSKPIKRTVVIASKYSAYLCLLLITNAIVWFASFSSIELFRGEVTYEIWPIVSFLFSIPVFQLVFFSFGFVATALTKKLPGIIGASVGIALVLYMLNALRRIIGGELLGIISPFYHFDPNYILVEGQWNPLLTIASILFIIVSNIIALKLFLKRDFRSAV